MVIVFITAIESKQLQIVTCEKFYAKGTTNCFMEGRFFHSSPNYSVSVTVNKMQFLQKTKTKQKTFL